MNHADIDRALREDRSISASPGFAARVMGEVRREATEHQAIPFPWRLLGWGLTLCGGLIVAAIVGGLFGDPVVFSPSREVEQLLERLAPAVIWALTTLLGSYTLTLASLRLAGYRS